MKKQHISHSQNTAQLEAKISALKADLLEKEAVISEKDSSIQKLTQDVEHLAFQNDQMRRLIFGSKRERFIPQVHPDQLTLSFEEEVAAVSKAVKEEQEKIRVEYERRKVRKEHPGRMQLP
ncbi:IS66 family transposase, partial [Saccharicrinis fermentans]